MSDDLEFELGNIASGIDTLQDTMSRIADLLETISDGLFYLNLHVGADVKPWTAGATMPVPGAGESLASGSGTVKWYDAGQGFGFIIDSNGIDVFVHQSALVPGLTILHEGQRVGFEVMHGDRGPMAFNTRLL